MGVRELWGPGNVVFLDLDADYRRMVQRGYTYDMGTVLW